MASMKPKILVVEDEPVIAMLLRSLLAQRDVEVIGPFAHVEAAFKALGQQLMNLALLDIQIGSEFAFSLASALVARRIPLVFVSGHGSNILPTQFEGYPYLTKPFRTEELLAAVDRHLLRDAV
jgi:DNA-binding response OmpR family regulator